MLLNILVETLIQFIFQNFILFIYFLMNRKLKKLNSFKIEIYIINVFTVNFDQFNVNSRISIVVFIFCKTLVTISQYALNSNAKTINIQKFWFVVLYVSDMIVILNYTDT